MKRLIFFSLLLTFCCLASKTYDLKFDTSQLLGAKYEIEVKNSVDETVRFSLFNKKKSKWGYGATFTFKDARRKISDTPQGEFVFKKLEFCGDKSDLDFSHIIGKAIKGSYHGNNKFEFSCDGETISNEVCQILKCSGLLAKEEFSFYKTIEKSGVVIGQKWNQNGKVIAASFKDRNSEVSSEDIKLGLKLTEVFTKQGEEFCKLNFSGTAKNIKSKFDWGSSTNSMYMFPESEMIVSTNLKAPSSAKFKYRWEYEVFNAEYQQNVYQELTFVEEVSQKIISE